MSKLCFFLIFQFLTPFKNLATLTHILMVVFSFSKQMMGSDCVMVKFDIIHSSVGNSYCCVLAITGNMTGRVWRAHGNGLQNCTVIDL